MPPMPEGAKEGILRGIYRFKPARSALEKHVQLFGCGSIMNSRCCARRQLLAEQFGVSSDVWGVTSYQQLRRDALACERRDAAAPGSEAPRVPYIDAGARGREGPVHRGLATT